MARQGAARNSPTAFSWSVRATAHNGSDTSRANPLEFCTFWQAPGSVSTQSGSEGDGEAVEVVRVGVLEVVLVRVGEVSELPELGPELEEEEDKLGRMVEVLSVVAVGTVVVMVEEVDVPVEAEDGDDAMLMLLLVEGVDEMGEEDED